MISHRVSLKDIAIRAGVHATTVSLALKDGKRLPQKTRTRIQNLAKSMGYQPDPLLSALASYKRNTKLERYQGTLAWINTSRIGMPPSGDPEYIQGARTRCEQLGYKLDEFHLDGTTPEHLSRMLRARNIQGLLLPPQPTSVAELNMDWDQFSAVSFGFSLARPRLHLVANSHYRSARMAIRAMRAHGYRRIGFATIRSSDIRTNENFTSGYQAEERHFSKDELIPMFIYNDMTETGPRLNFERDFLRWYEAHRPEAILTFDDELNRTFKRLKISYETCGLASLMVPKNSKLIAGIYQNGLMSGQTATDFAIGMVLRNEKGIPNTPLQILVDGIWIDAPSLPRRMPKP